MCKVEVGHFFFEPSVSMNIHKKHNLRYLSVCVQCICTTLTELVLSCTKYKKEVLCDLVGIRWIYFIPHPSLAPSLCMLL